MNDFMDQLTGSKAVRFAAVAALALLALFLLVKTIDELDGIGRSDEPIMNTISVTGEGRASAIPDVARITYTVTETGASVAEAQQKATERANNAIAAIEEMGVEEKDVRTLYYNVSTQYDYSNGRACAAGMPCPPSGAPRVVGFEVSQSVEVKVRDTAKASDAIAKLGSLGVQNISGPNFTVDDPEKVRAEARAEAIEKARAQAKELAKQLGVNLGRVVNYSDNSMGYPYYGYGGVGMDAAKSAAPTPALPTGENEYTVNVSIIYELR